MLYHPDLIVYLWLLPIVILIIIPILLKTGCAIFRKTSRGKVACAREYARQNRSGKKKERRITPRVEVIGVVAQVRGTDDYCNATVANVSALGLCLKNIPQALLEGAKKFHVTVSTHIENFEMVVYPRWEKLLESGYLVGAEIENAPQGWNDYIAQINSVMGDSATTPL